jgi:hypothetical protein
VEVHGSGLHSQRCQSHQERPHYRCVRHRRQVRQKTSYGNSRATSNNKKTRQPTGHAQAEHADTQHQSTESHSEQRSKLTPQPAYATNLVMPGMKTQPSAGAKVASAVRRLSVPAAQGDTQFLQHTKANRSRTKDSLLSTATRAPRSVKNCRRPLSMAQQLGHTEQPAQDLSHP